MLTPTYVTPMNHAVKKNVAPVNQSCYIGSMLLEQWIDQRSLSLRQAAKELGISHTTVSRLLQGYPISTPTLIKLRQVRGLASLRPEDFGPRNGADE